MLRKISFITKGMETYDGAGVKLVRVFSGKAAAKYIDPFLMMDVFDSQNKDEYMSGFPFHPHRGIETITYLIDGEIEHSDSLGNKGVIGPLSSQWMTAGSGIIHQEMPRESKRLRGAQIWLNLPRENKMAAPTYNDITPEEIPVVEEENATIRVISGSYKDKKGFTGRYVDATYLDVDISKDEVFEINLPRENNASFYIVDGDVFLNDENDAEKNIYATEAVVLSDGDSLSLRAGSKGARILLLYGRPLNEPIAFAGPIVMNTEEEIREAFREINEGNFIK